MKTRSLPLVFAALLGLACHSHSASTPVGFVVVTVPAGSVSSPSYTPLSIPLYQPTVFTGAISALNSATQITIGNAAWASGELATSSAPHFVKITSGSGVGRLFLITANTTNQLTVSLANTPTIADLRTSLSVADSIEILPGNTLGSFFGTTTPALTTGANESVADNVNLLDGPGQGWSTYCHDGTNWRKSGDAANQNNAVLYPDEGILIVHRGASAVKLAASGVVATDAEKTDIGGTASTFVAQRYPLDTTLSAVGYQAIPGWVSGVSVNTADSVWAWNSSLKKWEQFYFNGSNWRKAGSIANQNTRVLPAGSAVIVIRRGTGAPATLTQSLPYVP